MDRDLLLKHLAYNPETGALIRKIKLGRNTRLGVCGCVDAHGYVQVTVLGKQCKAHRLIWLMVHGELPKHQIDHIDGVRHNNRLDNLRLATNGENMRNRGRTRANTSGFKGVTFHKAAGKWMAQIMTNYKRVCLGLFPTPEAAHAAYLGAVEKYHKEFARAV